MTRRLTGKGSFKFHRARWEDVPFQYPIINALADLPTLELRGASVTTLAATGAIGDPSAGTLAEVILDAARSTRKTMPTELPPIRRIVTGDWADGRSCIIADGEPPVISTVATRPGLRNANMWSTSATPAPVDAPDRIAEHKGLYPPKNGTVIRVMDIPPEPQDRRSSRSGSARHRRRYFPTASACSRQVTGIPACT